MGRVVRGERRRADTYARVSLTSGPSYSRDAEDDDEPFEPPRIRLGFAPPRRDVDPKRWEGDDS
jgi:hypothetical protein